MAAGSHDGRGRVSPLVANADAPALQVATAVLFVAVLIGPTLQVRRWRAASLASST